MMNTGDEVESWGPCIGDTAFHNADSAPNADWTFNACMTRWPSISRYAEGYRTGAVLLFKYLSLTGERQYNDVAIYPIMFCWRQYLELRMKGLILSCRVLLHDEMGTEILHHRLKDIWAELRPLLDQVGGAKPENLDALDGIVSEFVKYDPDSIAFRYPTDRKGSTTQAGIPALINIKKLNEVMERVSNFLDAGSAYIHYALEMKQSAEFAGP